MSRNVLRDIKLSFEWEDYIEENLLYKKAGNGEYRINCLKCDDKKYKLYINANKRFFNCFKCDFRTGAYDLFDFVSLAEGITRNKALLRLAREYVPTTPVDLKEIYMQKQEASRQAKLADQGIKYLPGLPEACRPLRSPAIGPGWDYLLARGLTEQEVLDLGVNYVPEGDFPVLGSDGKRKGSLGNRVVFPIYGGDNSLVSWQGRVADINYSESDKYLAAPETDLAKTLFPYVPPFKPKVVLVEGVLDAIAVRRCPGVSAYATFGKKVSREQIKLLKLWGVTEVTLFFDKKDAKKEMERDAEILKMYFSQINVLDMVDWPSGLDAGDCLADKDGVSMLTNLLDKKIDVYSLDYSRWLLSF